MLTNKPWISKDGIIDAPVVYFGGKSRAAALIWERLGNVPNFVDPFMGSMAVLLGRPHPTEKRGLETCNDADGFVVNAYRAIRHDPELTAHFADWPVSECDMTARHAWIVRRRENLVAELMGDPEFFDAKIAGWFLHGVACWIGSGYASGQGPWVVEGGLLVDSRKLPHLAGNKGVNPEDPSSEDGDESGQLPAMGEQPGVGRQLPSLGSATFCGVNRQLPRMGPGRGVEREASLIAWFLDLADRLRDVRITCGDWSRILGPSVTTANGTTGLVLDPPYSGGRRPQVGDRARR